MSDLTLMLVGFGRLFAECLVQAAPEFRVVEAQGAIEDVLRRVGDEQPDIVTVDSSSMNGHALDMVRSVGTAAPKARVIAYGLDPTQETVLRWIEAGANGYLPRDASLAELKRTVQLVAAGAMPATPEMAFALFSRLAELARARRRTAALESLVLTQREIDVLRLIAEGLPNRDIAQRLSLSFHTVKNHVQNIFKKIDVTRRIEAVDHARRQGWLHE
jgi:DNA-binding NarL/FixJ family response regulator